MNIWERYPSKGTHYEWNQAKAKLHTFEYYVHYGRDRDDWRGPHRVKATTKEEASAVPKGTSQTRGGLCGTKHSKSLTISNLKTFT